MMTNEQLTTKVQELEVALIKVMEVVTVQQSRLDSLLGINVADKDNWKVCAIRMRAHGSDVKAICEATGKGRTTISNLLNSDEVKAQIEMLKGSK